MRHWRDKQQEGDGKSYCAPIRCNCHGASKLRKCACATSAVDDRDRCQRFRAAWIAPVSTEDRAILPRLARSGARICRPRLSDGDRPRRDPCDAAAQVPPAPWRCPREQLELGAPALAGLKSVGNYLVVARNANGGAKRQPDETAACESSCSPSRPLIISSNIYTQGSACARMAGSSLEPNARRAYHFAAVPGSVPADAAERSAVARAHLGR